MTKRGRGRPTDYNEERAKNICDRLRMGATRKAAAESVGVHYTTFLLWIEKSQGEEPGIYSDFSDMVIRAEADAEVRNTGILNKAANGVDAVVTTRTVKTVYKMREIKHKDGTVVKEPVAMQDVSETTVTSREYDWRASLEWLKRRRNGEWGDRVEAESTITIHEGAREAVRTKLAAFVERNGSAAATAEPEHATNGAGSRTTPL